MFDPQFFHLYVESPAPDIFTSRNDPQDKRVGDLLHNTPSSDNRPTVALLGVPQDIGVQRNSGRTGAAAGPDAIRRALYKLTPYTDAGLVTDNVILMDIGNLIVKWKGKELPLEEIHKRQQEIVAYLIKQGIIPIVLGGGHDIAYPNAAGFGQAHPNIELGVINIDPHTDVRPLIDGKMAHSGSPFRQMLEDQNLHIPQNALVEFGTQRFAVAQAHVEYLERHYMPVVWYHDIRQQGFRSALQTAFERATGKARPLFVSFDMDSVRSADAPGVSAPASIGFTGDELCEAAEFFGASPLTKMIDIAEVNPSYDVDGRTAKLAALVLMHFLAGVGQRNK